MIAPSARLLGVVLVLLVPAATLLTFSTELAVPAGALCVLIGVVATLDALFSLGKLDRVRAELPERAHVVHRRTAALLVRLESSGKRQLVVGVALEVPESLELSNAVVNARLTAAAPTFAEFSIRALRRGLHQISMCRLETASFLRLWRIRAARRVLFSLSAYPDLRTEQRVIAGLFSTRSSSGVHRFRQVGRGREFERVRDYLPGDPVEHIHWKASAKRGRPVTKLYQAERSQRIYVAIDASRTSLRASSEQGVDGDEREPVLEKLIRSALLLGKVTESLGDQFGLITFSDRVQTFVQAKRGPAHFRTCREALVTLEGRKVNADYADFFAFVGSRIKQRSLIIVLTSLDDPALSEQFCEAVRLVNRQHLVLVTSILESGVGPLFETGTVQSVDEIYGKLSAHLLLARLEGLRRQLASHQVALRSIPSVGLTTQVVDAYIGVKRRQVL